MWILLGNTSGTRDVKLAIKLILEFFEEKNSRETLTLRQKNCHLKNEIFDQK